MVNVAYLVLDRRQMAIYYQCLWGWEMCETNVIMLPVSITIIFLESKWYNLFLSPDMNLERKYLDQTGELRYSGYEYKNLLISN